MYMARTQSSTAAAPLLSFIYQDPNSGYMQDVEALSYAIFDVSTPVKELSPVAVVAKTALSVDPVPLGNRLSVGRYFAPLTVGEDWDLGSYQVVWYYDLGAGEVEVKDTLIVTDEVFGPPLWYVTVQDMYDAGLDPDAFTVPQVRAAIRRAHEFVEWATGRRFVPTYKRVVIDGRGGPKLRLREPIIAVESIVPADEFVNYEELARYSSGFHVYNRHIRLGMLQPDDRNNPKIEISYGSRPNGPWGRWPDGSQDVSVVGVFGYTDPDGSPYGHTPELIRYITKLLASMYIHPEAGADGEGDSMKSKWKVVEEKTDLQSVRYGHINPMVVKGAGTPGFLTGDDEIDSILLRYRVGIGMTGA